MATSYAGPRPRQGREPTPARGPFELPPRLVRYRENAEAAIAQPFVGLTTDGTVVPDLFPLRATGVSTRPIQEAAEAFLTGLDPEQRAQATFDVGSDRWRAWSNIHPYIMRHGVGLEAMTLAQRDLALALLRTTLSAYGFQLARDVMRLNYVIGEITGKWEEYGEWYYWISILGTPSAVQPWGWQIDGHHLIVNCFVLGDQVVMMPAFMGSEPTVAHAGSKYAGTRVFDVEDAKGLALMQALTPGQRAQATIGDGPPYAGFAAAYRDNLVVPYAGVRADALDTAQQARLLDLIGTYVGWARDDHARVRLDEVRAHLAETYFGWMGGCEADSVFYYRVHSPVLWIEFDHQAGLALEGDAASRNHIHTVVRTPNGNDYGHDLLRQHYAQHPHHRAAGR
jgi:hypothetical protein